MWVVMPSWTGDRPRQLDCTGIAVGYIMLGDFAVKTDPHLILSKWERCSGYMIFLAAVWLLAVALAS